MNDHLMTSRRFAPLFWTQFLSAFNDNFLKNSLVFLILFRLAADEAASLVSLSGAIFIAPFLLLSALGGELADRFDKAAMARSLKLAEIAAAALSVVGIALSSIPVLLFALFVFGVIAALFGPVKYGILPDHLERKELPRANAWIESGTFGAILGGTIVGGLVSAEGVSVAYFGPLMMALAIGCWLVSRYIPPTGSAAPDLVIDKNIFRSTWRLVSELWGKPRLWIAALMTSWFWMIGAVVLSILPTLVKNNLGGSEVAVTAYLAVFAIAIAVGSAIAAWMSQGRMVLLAGPCRDGFDGLVRARSCLDDFGHAGRRPGRDAQRLLCRPQHRACGDRPRRLGDRRRLSHRADLCRGSGVGSRGSSRPRRCRREHRQCRLHDRRRRAGRGNPGRWRVHRTNTVRPCRIERDRRLADAEIPADQRISRFHLDPVPRRPPPGGRRARQPQGCRSVRRSWRSTMSASSTVRWR